jgi:hypothetical protein
MPLPCWLTAYRSLLSSRESADGSLSSPNWVSIDFDVALNGKAGAEGHSRWIAHGKEAAGGSPTTAARARRSSNGQGRLSNADGAAADAAAAAASGSSAAYGVSVGSAHGWLWHSENPVKVLTCQEAPLLCCAWTKGPEVPKLVVGSAAGWVVVVDCEGEEMEDSMVSRLVARVKHRTSSTCSIRSMTLSLCVRRCL